MPSFRDAFPSRYLKAADLSQKTVATITGAALETIGTGPQQATKIVVAFLEPQIKPLVLNLINGDSIAEISGSDDYETWKGTRIVLTPSRTEYQGRRVPCIRIEAPPASTRSAPARRVSPPPATEPPATDAEDLSDIPF